MLSAGRGGGGRGSVWGGMGGGGGMVWWVVGRFPGTGGGGSGWGVVWGVNNGMGGGAGPAGGGGAAVSQTAVQNRWQTHATRDQAFIRDSTAALAPNEKIAMQSLHIDRPNLDPALEPLPYRQILTSFTADPDIVEALAATYFSQATPTSPVLPGFQFLSIDCEFEVLQDQSQVAALTQIGCQRDGGYDVLQAHIAHLHRIPSSFRRVVEDRQVIKLAHDASGDIKTLEELEDISYPVGDPRRRMKCRSFLEIHTMAIAYWELIGEQDLANQAKNNKVALSRLAEIFCGFTLAKAPCSGTSWATKDLPFLKKKYA
ncbi:hypothetical protein HDV00_002009 [Rhizophlyctis rosea]|nr:hypothetical protein HDV00_002009 [Rhizophlyctis rosea]